MGGNNDSIDIVDDETFLTAARNGDPTTLTQHLDAGKSITTHDYQDWTAFDHALSNSHINCAYLLVKHGYPIDAITKSHGSTLLMYAAQKGDLNMVVELLDRGADVFIRNEVPPTNEGFSIYGFTAVDFALNATGRYLDCVVAIIKKTKFPVDWLDVKYGSTPLMFAAQVGNLKVVKELIALGADVNMVQRIGIKTALDFALDKDDKPHLYCMMELVRSGANCNHRHVTTGLTPLMYAAKGGNLNMCMELVRLGASVLAVNEKTNQNVFSLVKADERMDIFVFLCSQTSREVVDGPLKVGQDDTRGNVDGSLKVGRDDTRGSVDEPLKLKRDDTRGNVDGPLKVGRDNNRGNSDVRTGECCSCLEAVNKLEMEVLSLRREVELLKLENLEAKAVNLRNEIGMLRMGVKANDNTGETVIAEENYVFLSEQVDDGQEGTTERVDDDEGATSANSLYSSSLSTQKEGCIISCNSDSENVVVVKMQQQLITGRTGNQIFDGSDASLESRNNGYDGPSTVSTSTLVTERSPSVVDVNRESGDLDKLRLNDRVINSADKASVKQLKAVFEVKEHVDDSDSVDAVTGELKNFVQSGGKENLGDVDLDYILVDD
ncbi:hypothetical protein HDU76_009419 [Blyttiomyces sp. JEL0837]|nr:hypothetical protein HDU76_009419 [Blyttiomyces sp. JEL0837]